MILLCADLSLRRPGFAILRYNAKNESVSIIEKGSLDNKKNSKPHGQVLKEIGEELLKYQHHAYMLKVKENCNLVLVRERGFSRFAAETQALHKVIGVADMIAWLGEMAYHEIAPVSIKKLITDNAKAKKEEVASA